MAFATNDPLALPMMTVDENLMGRLCDAHAMGEQAEKMLSATAERLKNYPVLEERSLTHLDQPARRASWCASAFFAGRGRTSSVKDVAARSTATAPGCAA
ncbi:DUF892 family protein [Variovorax sp. RCC_210]|uniref:DUF892 family protein n=1 Tax=Variovorax sp. RCC_210 TaxID=3239217 RepID=UPI003525B4B9